jgi:hypothetical protein
LENILFSKPENLDLQVGLIYIDLATLQLFCHFKHQYLSKREHFTIFDKLLAFQYSPCYNRIARNPKTQMARQLKSWESPRNEGRNDKGKGGSARQRQLKKRTQMLRQKLKDQSNENNNNQGQNKKGENHDSLSFLWDMKPDFFKKSGFC